jgi:cytochrome P450
MREPRIDPGRRRVALDPRDPAFYNDPYPAYRAIREAAPIFFWEQYGFWCFARHADVSALLRDRRFGRQILHVASRRELGWDEPGAHLKPFLDLERHSLLELEPPSTRGCAISSIAHSSRGRSSVSPRASPP